MLKESLEKRKSRSAYRIKKFNKSNRPILNVYKSNLNIYAQIVDIEGKVLVSFSTKTKGIDGEISGKAGIERAEFVGKNIAELALKNGIKDVVFNKGPYQYIGRVKALADAARNAGLNF